MIDEIQVKNLALIANATLEPCAGLTVLTGETGAGKTALLTALKLLMGERGDKSYVRDGQRELYVAGRFVSGGDEVVAVRRVTEDGRSRVTLDGEMAGTGELAARIAPLVDLCSQHENQQLTKPANHLALLDAWCGPAAAEARIDYENAWSAAKSARAALDAVEEASRATGARLDQARYTLRRIDAVNPKEGEYEELLAELRRAENAEALATAADSAYRALSGSDFGSGAADLIAEAAAALEGAARHDAALGATAAALRDAEAAVQDAAMWARSYRDDLDFDAEGLGQKQERVAAMQGLMRAFGPRMEDVLTARAEAADLVSMVDDAELRLAEATRALDAAEARLAEAQVALHGVRAEAAPRLGEAITAQMQRLEMGSARVICQVTEQPRGRWTASGGDAVELLFASGAALTARPLAKIASGGEISRVMLAIKVVLGEADAVDTLVFDEVDAGVGGATALALAEVIADLARTHQVIVVTHLAQVAARAHRHYLVRKTADERPETILDELDGPAREAEIARMLGGAVTDASRAHARELLAAAAKE